MTLRDEILSMFDSLEVSVLLIRHPGLEAFVFDKETHKFTA